MNIRGKHLVFSLILAVLFSGCGPSFQTEKLEMPKAPHRGGLSVAVKPAEGVTRKEAARVKELLLRSFQEAGYASNSNSGRTLDIVVTKFEHDSSSNNTATAVGVGCAYICILAAPCLLLPGYNNPKFALTADVIHHANGHEVFSNTITERASASANAFERGNEEFKEALEALAVHNLAVDIIRHMNQK